MERLIPALVLLLVTLLVFWLMLRGWRSRAGSQSGLPTPARPVVGSPVLHGPIEGMYVATTSAGDPYDRIAVHGLGLRTAADVVLTEAGLVFDRAGVPFTYVDLVADPAAAQVAIDISGRRNIPVVVFPDGTYQVGPYKVYVETTGNTKVVTIRIVS